MRPKGFKHSIETIDKIVKSREGYKHSEETKNKISLSKIGKPSSRKGYKHTEETRKKMSLAKKGCITWMKGKHHLDSSKEKISKANKGKIRSVEVKQKMSISSTGRKREIGCNVGEKNPMYGKKHTKDAIKIISKTWFEGGQTAGDKHWNWRGGIAFEPYPLGWTQTFREQIRYRDSYKCQLCGMPEIEQGRKLEVHHIDYDKKNIKPDNLITLCKSCHMKTNFNREYWKDLFSNIKIKNL